METTDKKIEAGDISLCEEMVISTIWDATQEPDLSATVTATNKKFNKNWKPQTISTFLCRMVKKKVLSFYRVGRYCYYRPNISKEEYIGLQLAHLADTFEDGDLNEINKILSKLINEKETKRVCDANN